MWLLFTLLSACTIGPGSPSSGSPTEAEPPAGSETIDGTSGTASTPSGSTDAPCVVESFPPQQLRLLSRSEYDRSVRALFPELRVGVCGDDMDCDDASSCVAERCTPDPCGLRTFSFAGEPEATVGVSGTFTDWEVWDLSWSAELGQHRAKLALDDGVHDYVLVVDGVEQLDPANPEVDESGDFSRLVIDCADAPLPESSDSLTDDLPRDGRPAGYPFSNHVESRRVTGLQVELYLDTAAAIARDVVFDVERHVTCPPGPACADAWIADLGRRAFRRDLSDSELDRYVAALLDEPEWSDGVDVVVQALLSSPAFLYRSEIGELQPDGTSRLDGHETATLLAYTLWGEPPDGPLLDAAAAGELDSDEGTREWAERMSVDPRSREAAIDFVVEWLGADGVLEVVKSDAVHADFDDAVRASALAGLRARVGDVLDGTGLLQDLFTGPEAWVDRHTAPLYGVPAPSELEPVVLPPGQEGGILRDVAIAATYAHADQSSPIHRGLLVRQRLLCQDLGEPPPAAADAPEVEEGVTTRERFAAHTADPACAGCHILIDEPGFAFEHLDAVGAWRDTEFGLPIDATGDVIALEGLGSGVEASVDGVADLAAVLADTDAVRACAATQAWRFAVGRLESADDACALEGMHAAAADGDLRGLWLAAVASPHFRTRQVPE